MFVVEYLMSLSVCPDTSSGCTVMPVMILHVQYYCLMFILIVFTVFVCICRCSRQIRGRWQNSNSTSESWQKCEQTSQEERQC
jgi:hypothetical protein